jgi:hypothetical protein
MDHFLAALCQRDLRVQPVRRELGAQLARGLGVVAAAGAAVDDDYDAVQIKLRFCYRLHTLAVHRTPCRPARQRPAIGAQVKALAKKPQMENLLFVRTVTVDLYSSYAILESLDQHNNKENRHDHLE